jgi:hypothetical protein
MVKLYKYFKKTEENEASQHASSHSNISGSDVIGKPIEDAELEPKGDSVQLTTEAQMEPESRVGAAISDLTTRRLTFIHRQICACNV